MSVIEHKMMTCKQLLQKIKDYNADKENWYREVSGYSKMVKDELIVICDKIDKAKKIKPKSMYISYYNLYYYICDENSTTYKRWKGNDDDECIEIEYYEDVFRDTRLCETRMIFIVPFGDKDSKMSVAMTFNTSSNFAFWFYQNVNEEDDETDDETDDA